MQHLGLLERLFPDGRYVHLIRDGRVETAQLWPLFITKVGVSAQIYDHAHTDAALYGIVAVLMATMAGWLGALGFRRT